MGIAPKRVATWVAIVALVTLGMAAAPAFAAPRAGKSARPAEARAKAARAARGTARARTSSANANNKAARGSLTRAVAAHTKARAAGIRATRGDSPAVRKALLARIPKSVRNLTGTYAAADGPNCLNAVSLWHGLTTKPTWTAWRKLDVHLQNKNKFRPLAAGEKPQFGDVVTYRHGPTDLIEHGAIVVNDTLVWEKASADKSSPYTFNTLAANAKEYDYATVVYYRPVGPAAKSPSKASGDRQQQRRRASASN